MGEAASRGSNSVSEGEVGESSQPAFQCSRSFEIARRDYALTADARSGRPGTPRQRGPGIAARQPPVNSTGPRFYGTLRPAPPPSLYGHPTHCLEQRRVLPQMSDPARCWPTPWSDSASSAMRPAEVPAPSAPPPPARLDAPDCLDGEVPDADRAEVHIVGESCSEGALTSQALHHGTSESPATCRGLTQLRVFSNSEEMLNSQPPKRRRLSGTCDAYANASLLGSPHSIADRQARDQDCSTGLQLQGFGNRMSPGSLRVPDMHLVAPDLAIGSLQVACSPFQLSQWAESDLVELDAALSVARRNVAHQILQRGFP